MDRDTRPRIGVTLMTDMAKKDDHAPRYGMNRTYFAALRQAGGIPIPLVPGDPAEMEIYLPGRARPARGGFVLDGLCLAGGGDPQASLFGQAPSPFAKEPDSERDRMEMRLLELARESGLPILGICRGIQMINVAWGGTLVQDIATGRPGALKHDYWNGHPRDYLAHEVRVEPESRLHGLIGGGPLAVNSLHHQAVDRLGGGLRATAWAPDGIVEALEPVAAGAGGATPFLLGVQWHPEELQAFEPMRRIFSSLVDAARGRRANH